MNVVIPETIRVLMPNGTVKQVELEEYVAGVVAAAMPAGAPLEAYKAQAVAARTFGVITRRHIERGAEVCAQRHCQVWQGIPTLLARQAAEETIGLVAVHNGKLIDAFYFEHCDGTTRDAVGVLLHPAPYLKSVPCSCGFATLKGHGIGMCQGGALVMARFGESFDAILKHYYTGIELVRATAGEADTAPKQAPRTPAVEPNSSLPSASPVEPPRTAGRIALRAHPPRVMPDAERPIPQEPPHIVEPFSLLTSVEETAPSENAPFPQVPQPLEKEPLDEIPTPVVEKQPEPERHVLSLDDIEETAWYPVGAEPDAEATRVENEILDDATSGRATLIEETAALPIWEEVAPAELAPPPDSLPEELPLVVPPPEEFLPPPVLEEQVVAATAPAGPTLLVDSLPGPRVIAGDLTRAGLIVTIADLEGNSVVTVSGTASQHGPGGFEAALPEPGAYDVSFDHHGVRVELQDETVFITYSA